LSEQGPPPVPGGRTAEERERARLEREARRAGRVLDGHSDGDGDLRPITEEFAPPPRRRSPRRPRAVNVRARRIAALVLLGLVFILSLIALPSRLRIHDEASL
jgi:hypothetical protein